MKPEFQSTITTAQRKPCICLEPSNLNSSVQNKLYYHMIEDVIPALKVKYFRIGDVKKGS